MANNREVASAARSFLKQFRLVNEFAEMVEQFGNFDETHEQFVRDNQKLAHAKADLTKEVQELNGVVSQRKATIAELIDKQQGVAATASVEAKEIIAAASRRAESLIADAEQAMRELESAHADKKETMKHEILTLKDELKNLTNEKMTLEHAIAGLKKKFA